MEISLVLPVYNEEGNLRPLFEEISKVMERSYEDWEAIFVDDGSSDSSPRVLREISKNNTNVTVVEFRRNYGQSEAIQAGLEHADGEVVVTLDSDMQNDPEDIPELVEKLESSECDLVNGWRREREDSFMKTFFSETASKMRRVMLGTDLHDYGCTLRAFTREVAESIELKGGMHRYIPPKLEMKGFKVCEMEVNHRERKAGETKYGWRRIPKGFVDMLNIWFWENYGGRPLHLFGGLGILSMVSGALLFIYALFQKFAEGVDLSGNAATVLSGFLILSGIQFFTSGLLADMMAKNYRSQFRGENFTVEEVV
ncbi:MAG: glycosyltransferase family 2 protein [Candidatus Nanosalina sp.]